LISDNRKKLKKPKPWKHTEAITPAQLKQMREEFWDTTPHYGGQKGSPQLPLLYCEHLSAMNLYCLLDQHFSLRRSIAEF
jgi:hypothetical protein